MASTCLNGTFTGFSEAFQVTTSQHGGLVEDHLVGYSYAIQISAADIGPLNISLSCNYQLQTSRTQRDLVIL